KLSAPLDRSGLYPTAVLDTVSTLAFDATSALVFDAKVTADKSKPNDIPVSTSVIANFFLILF
ncbi:hypothetical protein MOF37_20720, partial [Bacillus spizizenii]|nr:hypothetical protein [Bacillus spizizenii]